MKHEWKIGDWCDLHGKRYFVFDRVKNTVWAIPKDGGNYVILFAVDDPDIKWLDGCDSWDWQPPKPIEPPEGYRLLLDKDERLRDGDMYLAASEPKRWLFVSAFVDATVSKFVDNSILAVARKIPQVRPMTRDEFLTAWKQRGFCPLIDAQDDYDIVVRVIIDDCDDDQEIVMLYDKGWCSFGELSNYKFASDDSPLTVEE